MNKMEKRDKGDSKSMLPELLQYDTVLLFKHITSIKST